MLQDEGLLADHRAFVTAHGGGECGHGEIHGAVAHFKRVRLAVGGGGKRPAQFRAAVDGFVVVVGAQGCGGHVLLLAELHVLRVVDPRGPHMLRLHCVFA